MPKPEPSVARSRGHNPRPRTRPTRTATRAPALRHHALAAVPSLGPSSTTGDVAMLRAGPVILAVVCIAVAASGVAGITGAIILGLVAALALSHFVANAEAGSESRILRALGGREAHVNLDARLLNIVEGLCSAFGLSPPVVVVVPSEELNAVTFGRRGRRPTLVVTSASLERLERIDLEALVAHELAHLRRGDVERAFLIMSSLGFLALRSAAAARLSSRLGGVDRESFADFAATSITRYPPALADTLELLGSNHGELERTLPRDLVRLTGWQWCAPLAAQGERDPSASGLSLQERAQALREL